MIAIEVYGEVKLLRLSWSQLAFAGQLKSKWLLPEICGVTSSTQK